MYYFSTLTELPTKMDIVWNSNWNEDDQDPSQMHGSLCGPRHCEHQSPFGEVTKKYVCMYGIPGASAKSNDVVKAVENV